MAEPFLDLGDVGLMRERVRGGSRAQGLQEPIHLGADALSRPYFRMWQTEPDRADGQLAGAAIRHRAKHGASGIGAVADEGQVLLGSAAAPSHARARSGVCRACP